MNEVMRDLLSKSAQLPCYLEVSDGSHQYFLFFREKQIYSAGMIEDGHFENLTIKDFKRLFRSMVRADRHIDRV